MRQSSVLQAFNKKISPRGLESSTECFSNLLDQGMVFQGLNVTLLKALVRDPLR